MNVIDERNKRNRLRRQKKAEYDQVMKLSTAVPFLLSGRRKQYEDELERLRRENTNLKKELAALKAKPAAATAQRHNVYTDGIGE